MAENDTWSINSSIRVLGMLDYDACARYDGTWTWKLFDSVLLLTSLSSSGGLLCSRFMTFLFCLWLSIFLDLLLPFLLPDTCWRSKSLAYVVFFSPFIHPLIFFHNKTSFLNVCFHRQTILSTLLMSLSNYWLYFLFSICRRLYYCEEVSVKHYFSSWCHKLYLPALH